MALSAANEIAAKRRLLNLTARTAETMAVTKRTISIALISITLNHAKNRLEVILVNY